MLSDRKIRKAIKNELEQPPPFDEFCKKAGIEFPPEQKESKKRRWWIPVVSATAACAIIVCGCIPLMLPKDSQGGNDGKTIFADKDVAYTLSELSEIQSNTNIILFSLNAVQQYNRVYSICPLSDSLFCLGYEVKDVVYETQIDEIPYAYEFDYMVRLYKNFEFVQVNRYSNLTEQLNYKGSVYKYRITEEKAFIAFSVEKNDYFIELKGTDGVTEINQESVETFIEIAF